MYCLDVVKCLYIDPSTFVYMRRSRQFRQRGWCPNNVFFKSSTYFTEGRTNLPQETIGPKRVQLHPEGSVLIFLRDSLYPSGSANDPAVRLLHFSLFLTKRLNKTESAVFLYCRFSVFLNDSFFKII